VSAPDTGTQSSPRAGQIAGFGPRFLAFVVDGLIANLIGVVADGGFHNSGRHAWIIYVSFLAIELFFVAFAGQTPGMRAVGIGVLRRDRQGRLPFRWALVRTTLLAFVLPAVISDESGLGMHDRAAGSVIIHTR
jgi:uncharacterized RDD family membrane protein YckC